MSIPPPEDVVYLDAGPAETLDQLWDGDPDIAVRIEDALDALARYPGAATNRRRQIRREAGGPLWVITIRGSDADWLILWETDVGDTVVRFIGPDFAAGH